MEKGKGEIVYPYMPEGRSIEHVPADHPFMKLAFEARKKSNDHLFPNGAVIVKDGEVIGQGFNKPGYSNKTLIKWHKSWMCIRRWIKAKTGTYYWICPGCASSRNHSERRAIQNVKKAGKGDMLQGADIYLAGHWWCCKPCWDAMIEAGINRVYLVENAKESFETRIW